MMEVDLAELTCRRFGIPSFKGFKTSQKIKYKWFALGQRRCAYCCRQLTWESTSRPSKRTATIEHIVPKSKGGTRVFSNTLIACYECNAKRGDQNFQKFVAGLPRESWLLSKYDTAVNGG